MLPSSPCGGGGGAGSASILFPGRQQSRGASLPPSPSVCLSFSRSVPPAPSSHRGLGWCGACEQVLHLRVLRPSRSINYRFNDEVMEPFLNYLWAMFIELRRGVTLLTFRAWPTFGRLSKYLNSAPFLVGPRSPSKNMLRVSVRPSLVSCALAN